MRTLYLTLWAVLFWNTCLHAAASAKTNPKYAAIVVDARTGKTLFERHADALRYPASLTKMMTLYMVFEALEKGQVRLFQKLHVSQHAANQPPSKLYLKPGASITVHDAILALVTKSANDVAVVVGEALGKSEKNFAQMMTRKAQHLGLRKTTFGNASGLPGGQRPTTAREMARLSYILHAHFPQFYHYFSVKEFRYKGNVYRPHNKLLGKVPGCDGLKTGFTNASGYNLAASVRQGPHRVFAIVLGGRSGESRNQHMRELLTLGLEKLAMTSQCIIPKPAFKPAHLKTSCLKPALGEAPSPGLTRSSAPLLPRPLNRQPSAVARRSIPAQNSSVSQGWAIQVGTFSNSARALQAAQNAQKKIKTLKGARVIIVPTKGKKPLYQARIQGLTQDQASKARVVLKKAGQSCIVFKK